jgi:hypothetical protein
MYKPNNKKMLTVLITVAMVFSALAVLSLAAEPAFAATPSITFTPSELTVAQTGTPSEIGTTGVYNPTIATTSQIPDSSSATIYFFWSTGSSLTGISGSYYYSATPSVAGQTYISTDTVLTPHSGASGAPTFTAGESAYLIASTQSSAPTSAIGYGVFTVSSLTPTLDLAGATSASAAAGSTISVSGSGYNTSATSVTLYFNYSGSSVVLGTVSLKAGSIASNQKITVPTNMPELTSPGYYAIVALDSSPGETAVAALEITPAVTFSPNVIGTSAGQVISVTGNGFQASGWIQLNSATASITETNSAVQVGSDGSFSVTMTTTATVTSITSVTIKEYSTQTGGSSIASASAYVYPSTPGYSAMEVELASSASSLPSSTNSEVSGAMTAYFVAINFPANTALELTVGPISVLSFTTNSNGGYAGTYIVPTGLPAGTYTVTAINTGEGLSAQTTAQLTISGAFSVSSLTPGYSYLPSGYLEGETGSSSFAVSGTGFGAGESIVVAYSGTGTSGEVTLLFASGLSGDFQIAQTSPATALNGSFNVTVDIIDNTGLTANTAVSLSVYDGTTQIDSSVTAFVAYVSPTVTIDTGPTATSTSLLGAPSSSSSPDYILVTSNTLLPSTTYTLMFGTSDVTSFTTTSSGAITGKGLNGAPTPTSGIEFPVPSVSSGYYPINLALSGGAISIANPLASFFLVTVPGGTPTVVVQDTGAVTAPAPAGQAVGSSASDIAGDTISIFAYNFPAGSTGITLFSADSLFLAQTSISTGYASDTSGGAYATGSSFGGITVGTEPAGSYLVSAYATSAGATVYAAPSNSAVYTLIGSFNAAKYTVDVGQKESFSANGLAPNTNYVLLFNGMDITPSSSPYTSDSSGAISTTTFTVPYVSSNLTLGYSYYSLQLAPISNPTSAAAVASAKVKVEANTAITLSTSSQYAFPGQLVQFTVNGLTAPSNFVFPTDSSPGPIQYFANISLNGTLIATVPATFQTGSGGTTYLNGSFINPNNAPGSYYLITFTGYEQVSSLTSTGGSVTGGSIVQLALGNSQSGFFGLVSGNGALLTGISPAEIATLEAAINSTVSTSLNVPIADLNAAITSINGAVAKLKTTVGNITTDLSTINATVASIQKGMVLVQTDLGSISTSLASLNASLVAFNGNVVMINTTLGQVQTSLSSIGAQVTANGNGIATVKTDIGTVQGQITSTNGNITAIHTALGDLNATVNKISTSTTGIPTLEIFLIVIIVLVLITLVLAFLAVSAANKAARRATEEKKQ